MSIRLTSFCLSLAVLVGCSTESTRGAAEGAASGAVVGAVGGMVSALVFGGDIGDAAARGAVWGGSTGAVAEDDGEDAALAMLPELVTRDPKLTSTKQAQTLVSEVMDDLEQVRRENGMSARCG